jgi:hypothetical protein
VWTDPSELYSLVAVELLLPWQCVSRIRDFYVWENPSIFTSYKSIIELQA